MYKTVLLPVDLDEEPSWRKALPTALEYCRASDADLHVLTVVPDLAMGVTAYLPEDSGRKLIKHAKDTLAAFIEENVPETLGANSIVVQGTVYQRILEVAEEHLAAPIGRGNRPGVNRSLLLLGNRAGVCVDWLAHGWLCQVRVSARSWTACR